MREKNEDVGAVAPGKGIDGSPAGVAGCGADDGGALVALGQHMIHQPGEKLHGHILEGERRTVEELQHEAVRTGLHQWADGLVPEGCVGFAHQPFEDRRRDLAAEKRRQHADGEIGIGKAAHGADFGRGKMRPGARHVKPAVARQSRQHRVGKSKHGRFPAGTHILHRPHPYAGLVRPRQMVNFCAGSVAFLPRG